MILVTGGTGLVGAHLLYFLLQEHERVRATHRASSDLESVKRVFQYYTKDAESLYNKIEWVEANITELPALTKAFEGIKKVYHVAAYISFDPKNYRKLKKANVEGTANVVNLSLKFGVEKLCYVSSIATLGTPLGGAPVTEDTHWNPEEENSVYAITKYGAEMEVWRATQEGLQTVIVNPGVILGSGYWYSGSGAIIRSAAKGVPFFTQGSIGVVDVKDVVQTMITLMESTIQNERFILVGHNITYQELFTQLAELLGKKPPKKDIARWKLMFVSKLDWFSAAFLGSKRKLPKTMVNSLYKTDRFDASKVKEALPMEFAPLDETLERVTKRYLLESS